MLHQLINLSPDLKKLWNDNLYVEIKDGYLLIHHVPYLNSSRKIKYGTLISSLNLSGNVTLRPDTHLVYFIGEHPCNKDGSVISQIQHSSTNQRLSNNITINHSFSNKPTNGYNDYYDKMTRYIEIISAPAKSLDNSVSEKIFQVIESEQSDSVFNYIDTNSTRAEITAISAKLEHQKIAIIGLGGTGSYILDYISKTPVNEIHLFDGDSLLQHNAFRSPGAPSIEQLKERLKKTDYFKEKYSKMHRRIYSHDYYLDASNVKELIKMDFVFICIDKGSVKRILINDLENAGIAFIDVGIGVHIIDEKLIGILRVTTSTDKARDHINKRISFSDVLEDDYSKNIQIAELNSLNAALAVIKWKKLLEFYHDYEKEYNSTYSIDTNLLTSDEHEA